MNFTTFKETILKNNAVHALILSLVLIVYTSLNSVTLNFLHYLNIALLALSSYYLYLSLTKKYIIRFDNYFYFTIFLVYVSSIVGDFFVKDYGFTYICVFGMSVGFTVTMCITIKELRSCAIQSPISEYHLEEFEYVRETVYLLTQYKILNERNEIEYYYNDKVGFYVRDHIVYLDNTFTRKKGTKEFTIGMLIQYFETTGLSLQSMTEEDLEVYRMFII